MHKLLATATVLAASTAQAGIIYVDANCPGPGVGSEADPYCSIQTAIDNAAMEGDDIVVAPGTYAETINFLGKAIWLHSSSGPEVTIIDALQTGRVVTCENGEGPDTRLDGFTITGGNAVGKYPDDLGGGMLNDQASTTVLNCIFVGNFAFTGGGGMYNLSSSPTVQRCTFSLNQTPPLAADGGGAMYNFGGSPVVLNCTFTENAARQGGAMVNLGSAPTLVDCLLVGNTAQAGGAIANFFSNGPAVINCTFTGNTASEDGGAILDGGGTSAVTNSVLWMNEPSEILVDPKLPFTTVNYSTVQGGFPGSANIDADPRFVDPDNGDFRLSPDSPCIDAGDTTAVPEGVLRDLDGNPRFVADACAGAPGATVDMGAFEFQGTSCDLGNVMQVLAAWGPCNDCRRCRFDLDGDCAIGILDLLVLLGNWG